MTLEQGSQCFRLTWSAAFALTRRPAPLVTHHQRRDGSTFGIYCKENNHHVTMFHQFLFVAARFSKCKGLLSQFCHRCRTFSREAGHSSVFLVEEWFQLAPSMIRQTLHILGSNGSEELMSETMARLREHQAVVTEDEVGTRWE